MVDRSQDDLAQLVKKALSMGLASRKFTKLVRQWLAQHDIAQSDSEDEVAAALLLQTASHTRPPASLLGYITQSIATGLTSGRALVILLLFYISDDDKSISPSVLASLSSIITSNPTGLQQGDTLPSSLVRPRQLNSVPDVGTSASASTPSEPVSTLALLLPLLRRCCSSTPASAPVPLINLVSCLLALLQPYPAPPLDVGLEAGSFFQSLPDAISVPLRDCLSGLMADLAVSQDSNQIAVQNNTTTHPAPIAESGSTTLPTPSLPPFHTQLPLKHALSFQLALLIRSSRWTPSDATLQAPPNDHIALLRLGPLLSAEPGPFLHHLFRAALGQQDDIGRDEGIQRWLFTVERLPVLLKWWKQNPLPNWTLPSNLPELLKSAIEAEAASLSALNTWISTTYKALVHAAEANDDPSGFTQPEGWMLCSQQVSLVQRLSDLGLLQKSEAGAVLPGISIPRSDVGESLMARIANAPKSHLKALGHIAVYTPGAARSLSQEVYTCIEAAPQIQPTDNLLTNLSNEPSILSCLGGCISPATWMEIINSQLLDYPDDPALRADDPQGSKSRFGEGVLFAEAFVARFKLPLPDLLADARRAVHLADLEQSTKSYVNGWIKALFGSEGIDDEIILAMSPADFYRLAPGIIQQAVLATAAGQLDSEALQGGLSYFAQPLLSWSLGGITAWLAEEIIRNGPISAVHLNVLQTLVLNVSFPDGILHVNGEGLTRLLDQSSGLQPVFQSSNFDAAAVRQKLSLAGVSADPRPSSSPKETLRQSLQSVRTLELAPANWTRALLNALERSLKAEGPSVTLKGIMDEVLGSTVALPEDTLTYFAAFLLAQKVCVLDKPLFASFVNAGLPLLFDLPAAEITLAATAALASSSLARVLKQALLVTSILDPSSADALARETLDELGYQRNRPIAQQSEHDHDHKHKLEKEKREKRNKEKRAGGGLSKRIKADEVSVQARAALDAVSSALGNDEELRGRWSGFGELAGSPS